VYVCVCVSFTLGVFWCDRPVEKVGVVDHEPKTQNPNTYTQGQANSMVLLSVHCGNATTWWPKICIYTLACLS